MLIRRASSAATTTGQSVVRKNSAGSELIRRRLNLIEGSNVTLTVADDAVGDEVDITLAAAQKVRKNSTGSEFSRGRLNLIEGSNVTLTVADDAGNDEVDITLAATGDGGLASYQRPEAGSVARTLADKAAEILSVEDFGAVGDGVTDDLAAFNAAIAAMDSAGYQGAGAAFTRGERLLLAAKTYYLSGTLHLTRPLVMEGPAGDGFYPAAILTFPANTKGIQIHDANTLAGNDVSAAWATLRNIALQGAVSGTMGTVDTAGLTLTWASGTQFVTSTGPTRWSSGITITLGATTYVLDAVASATELTVLPWRTVGTATNGSATVTAGTANLFDAAWVGLSCTVNGEAHTIATVAGDGSSVTLNSVFGGATSTQAQFILLELGTRTGIAYRANVYHGVDTFVNCRLENLFVTSFAGNAVNVDTNRTGLLAEDTNANNFAFSRVFGYFCRGHGIYTRGGNSNNGIIANCDLSNNHGAGVWEEGFLGNHYTACHTSFNYQGAYVAPSTLAANTFVSCYSEGGQPASRFGQWAVVIGGDHGAGISALTHPLRLQAGDTPHAATVTALRSLHTEGATLFDEEDGANSVAGFLGTNEEGVKAAFALASGDETTWPTPGYRLSFAALAAGWWSWVYNVQSDQVPFSISAENADVGPGKLNIPYGFYLGWDTTRRFWDVGTAAPVAGVHAKGDIVWNVEPAAAGNVGWICTAAGEPGTWLAFGTIAS